MESAQGRYCRADVGHTDDEGEEEKEEDAEDEEEEQEAEDVEDVEDVDVDEDAVIAADVIEDPAVAVAVAAAVVCLRWRSLLPDAAVAAARDFAVLPRLFCSIDGAFAGMFMS